MRACLEKESKTLMVVGHLPYLSRLAGRPGWAPSGLDRDRVSDGRSGTNRAG